MRLHLLATALFALALSTTQAAEHQGPFGITMVDIPAGTFTMGSCKLTNAQVEENKRRAFLGQSPIRVNCANPDPDARDSETPQRQVRVAAFQLGKTEVTLGQFKQYIAASGRTDLVSSDFMKYNNRGDSAPVVWVSWDDAQAFVTWLNQKHGSGWRLPSEAEWEYACRAGGNHRYCGSNDLNAVGWYRENSGERQRPVASKRANAFGLHDMSGNVWEWVQDCYHENYQGAPTNGSAWTTNCYKYRGGTIRRLLRGGSWYNNARNSRAANRYVGSPEVRSNSGGFRLARTR